MKRYDEFLWNLPGSAKAHEVFMYEIEGIDIDHIVSNELAGDEHKEDAHSTSQGSALKSTTAKSLLSNGEIGSVFVNNNFGIQNFTIVSKATEKKGLGTTVLNSFIGAGLSLLPGWVKTFLTRLTERFL